MSHRKKIRAHYEPRIRADRESYDILDWADRPSQLARFEVLAQCVELDGRSLLDVGCGLGDLYDYLAGRGVRVDYTGVDIVEAMVAEARRRRPNARFVWGDVFSDTPAVLDAQGRIAEVDHAHLNPLAGERFDVVFCSGVFNLNLGNNEGFLGQALGRLFELARTHVVFNLLHHRTPTRYAHCVYYDPDQVADLLSGFPCRVRIVDHYLHNDFTVVCEVEGGTQGTNRT